MKTDTETNESFTDWVLPFLKEMLIKTKEV